MRACTTCGATSPLSATWCSQCYAPFAAPVAAYAGAPSAPSAPSAPAPVVPTARLQRLAAPAAWPSAPPPAPVPPVPGRMLSRRAFVLTVVAIGIGALGTFVSLALGSAHLDPATYLRYAIVLTLGVYVAVGLLIVTQITPSVRLRWTDGSPVAGIALGAAVGTGLSGVLLAIVSAAAGHLSPDPRIVTIMSEGDVAHIAAAVLIGCAAAPLIEEVLFRGLFGESLRHLGNAAAIWLSAAAFAVWHLNLAALRYYALLGALLGWLYVRRGLVCSIAAHLCFNGVLTLAAISVVLSGGGTVTADGLTVTLPRGWEQSSVTLPVFATGAHPALLARGPSGSSFAVVSFATPVAPSRERIADMIRTPSFAALSPGLEPQTLREVTVPVGTLIEVDAHNGDDHGTVAFLCHAGTSYEIVWRPAGSPKAAADLPTILASLRVR